MLGGRESISSEWFDQTGKVLPIDEAEPECWLHRTGIYSLNQGQMPAGMQVGTDMDFFVLPPLDPSQPTPMTGGATFASPVVDRPEVRAFMEFLASPQFGELLADDELADFVSPNRRFDLSNYGDAGDPVAAVRMELAQQAQAAVQSDAYRLDASDVMPPAIGGFNEELGTGVFWQGMLDWVDGTRSLEQVFADIDAEWAALRTNGASPPPDG